MSHFAFSRKFPWSFLIATALCLGIWAVKMALEAQIGVLTPFLLFFGAIMLATWNGGLGAGTFATLFSVALVAFYFLPPLLSWKLSSAGVVQCGVFVLEGIFISFLTALARETQEKYRAQVETQRALAELSQLALTGGDETRILFERAVALCAATLSAPRVALLQLERADDDDFLVARAQSGADLSLGQKAPLDAERARVLRAGLAAGELNGALLLPIGAVEKPWGLLEIGAPSQDGWTNEQLDWARAVAGILGVAVAAQNARERVAQGETRYRSFVEQSSEAIWCFEMDEPLDLSGTPEQILEESWQSAFLAECNDTFARMYGFERADEMVGMRLWQLMERDDPAARAYLLELIRAEFRVSDAESVEVNRDGERRIFLNNLTGIIQDGRLQRVWGTQRDVTGERAAARELSESELRFRSLFDAAPVPLVIGRERKILYANRAVAELVGYDDPAQLIGLDTLDFVAPDARAELAARARNRDAGQNEPTLYETLGQRCDGSIFPVRVEIAQIALPEGAATLIFLFDLTAQKRADAEIAGLLQSERDAAARAQKLQQISFDLLQQRPTAEVARVALQHVLEAVDASGCVLVAPDLAQTRLQTLAIVGYPDGALPADFSIGLGDSYPLAHVFQTRESLWMEDISAFAEQSPALRQTMPRTGTRSGAVIPLEVENGVNSVLGISWAQPQTFDASRRLFLLTLANTCAQALERARLDDQTHDLARAQQESLALLNTLLESAPVGFALLDRDGRYVLVNSALAKINGAPVAEHLGKTMDEVVPAPEPKFDEELRAVWRTEQPSGEFILSDESESQTRYCLCSLYPVRLDETDEILGVGALVIEISERVRAEAEKSRLVAELETERARFEAILQQMPSAVIIAHAPSGRLILGNSQVERVMGQPVSLDGIPNYGNYRAFWPDGRELAASEWPMARAVERGEIVKDQEVIVPHRAPDGAVSNRVLRITAAPIRDRDGQITAGIAVFDDVTARARNDAAQRFLADAGSALIATLDGSSSQDRLAQLCVPDVADWCVFALPGDDGLLHQISLAHAQTAAAELARRLRAQLESDPDLPWDIAGALEAGAARLYAVPAWDEARASSQSLELMRELGARSVIVAPLHARGRTLGVMIWIAAGSGRLYDARDVELAEELARRAALTTDNARLFREARQARDQAQAANAAKDEFLAVVSHELRTPLTPILGWLDLLRAPGMTDELRAQGFDVIERNARAQAQLVNDILDVSRITSGKLRLTLQTRALTPIVRDAVNSLKMMADAKNLDLQLDLSEVGEAALDADRFQQVVWNLLSNAIKFTPDGGAIAVSLERENATAILEISDNGAGIAPEFLPSVFEAFRQADSSSTRKAGGLGLGLAIARHIVQEHGGNVSARSQGAGQGATFRVEIPLLAAPGASIRAEVVESNGAPESISITGARVLLIDDEADTRETLARVLEQQGARVRVAASAQAALQALELFEPQIVISDIGMPETDGYSLLDQLRARLPDVPAIALTAYAAPADIERALAVGFNRHLAKPVEARALLGAVGALLDEATES